MELHCLIITALEETEYIRIALRDFAKSLRELKIFSSKKVFSPHCRANYLVYLVF